METDDTSSLTSSSSETNVDIEPTGGQGATAMEQEPQQGQGQGQGPQQGQGQDPLQQQPPVASALDFLRSLHNAGAVPQLIHVLCENHGLTAYVNLLSETRFENEAQPSPRIVPLTCAGPAAHSEPAAFPMMDMAAACNDYVALEHMLLMTELHYQETVRIWHALQAALLLLATAMAQQPVAPIMDPQDPNYNQESVDIWNAYQQQLDELIQVAEIFALLIQYEMYGAQQL